MSDEAKRGLSWLTLTAKILGIVESLLPAFLVALNNSLRQKNQALQQEINLLKIKRKEDEENAKTSEPSSSRVRIDAFLSRK